MRLLIIKLSALGDIVHTLPALHLLRDSMPELEIDWLTKESFRELLSEQKAITQVWTLGASSLKTAWQLRSRHYDVIIDFQGLIKTAFLAKLCGAPVLGFAKPRESLAALLYDYKLDIGTWNSKQEHVIDKNRRLAKYALEEIFHREPLESFAYGFQSQAPKVSQHKLLPKLREICFLAATTWESKLWPTEYWVELAIKLYHKDQTHIHILGTAQDQKILEPLLAQLRENCIPVSVHQDFKLKQLPSFFRTMDLIVGVDTGPLHIAAATVDPSSTYILGIYGPSSPHRSGPYGFETVSAEELFGHKPLNKRKRSQDSSMQTIVPDLVLAHLKDVMNSSVSR